MPGPCILLIEDEPAIADTLIYALRTEGFAPDWQATGQAGLAVLSQKDVALVILDIGLPDGSGFELCKHIRAAGPVPLLFLTARSGEIDRVLGLELGADDYVTKPFSPREVTARVKAILRRTQAAPVLAPPRMAAPSAQAAAPGSPLSAGAASSEAKVVAGSSPVRTFSVDGDRCEICFAGVRLDLTRYEYRLLKTLLKRPGKVYSRDELMTQAWEDPGASLDRTVDAHIKMLRAKLRAIAPDLDPIQTHRGLGYSMRSS